MGNMKIEIGDVNLNAPLSNTRSWKDFADLINDAWRKGAGALIQIGRHLVEAKAELDRDQFDSLLQSKLVFDASVARKLIRIAENKLLCAHAHNFPPCWTTLYELSKLTDNVFEAAIANGRIHPGMQRKDAIALRKSETGEPSHSGSKSKSSFAAVWDAASKEEISAKLDQVGRHGLCEVLSGKLRAELSDHILAQTTAALGQNGRNSAANAEMAALARASSALLTHPEQNADNIRKKMARIRKLTGCDGKGRGATTAKSNAKLDVDALGLAGQPGKNTATRASKGNGSNGKGHATALPKLPFLEIDDAMLATVIRAAGITRTLEVAAAVENGVAP